MNYKFKNFVMILTIVSVVFSIGFMNVETTNAQERIVLAHDMAPDRDTPTHAFALVVKQFIEAETDGEYTVDIFPAAELGGERDRLDQTADGMIHINLASLGGMGMIYEPMYLYNTPFMYRSNRHYREFFERGEWNEYMFEKFREETTNLEPIHAYQRGTLSAFTNNVRPIRSLEDFEGITFRAMDEIQIEMFEALGASATIIPFEEVYTALQMGTADGQVNPVAMIQDMGFHEVQDYLTLANCIPGSGFVVVSENWYFNLPEEVRNIVEDSFHYAFVTAAGLSERRYFDTLEYFMEETDIEINALYRDDPEGYQEVREIGREVVLEWATDQMDPEIVERYEENVLEIEKELYGD